MGRPVGTGWSAAATAVLVAAVVLVAASCGDPPDDRVPGPEQLRDEVPEAVDTIAVDDDGFTPDEITITANEGLDLVNEGDGPHGFDGGEEFGTGLLEPGERTLLVLREAGEYPYTDPADPDHEGVIVVEPDPDDPDTTAGD